MIGAILDHLRSHWTNHMSAGLGTFFTVANQQSILNGIVVGVNIYIITHIIQWAIKKVIAWWKNKKPTSSL